MRTKYFTQTAFVQQACAAMRADPSYSEVESGLSLESFSVIAKNIPMKSCHIDLVGDVAYGSNEGIIGGLYINEYDNNGILQHTCVALVRTLNTDKPSFLRMGHLATLLAYHANQLVKEHMDRFD